MYLKQNRQNMTSQNKLRHEKTTDNWCDVLIISLGVGETRPCRGRVLTKCLSQAKVVVVAASWVHHVETMVAEELVSMTDRLWKIAARSKYRE